MAHAILAILLASAIAATLVGRRANKAVSQGRCLVLFNTITSDRCDNAKLCKMGTDRIDHCGLLANEQMAGAMEHQAALLLGCLNRHEPHVCPGDRLADGPCPPLLRDAARSFNHLVRSREQHRLHIKPQGVGSLQVDH
jgi:hypothetical protein